MMIAVELMQPILINKFKPRPQSPKAAMANEEDEELSTEQVTKIHSINQRRRQLNEAPNRSQPFNRQTRRCNMKSARFRISQARSQPSNIFFGLSCLVSVHLLISQSVVSVESQTTTTTTIDSSASTTTVSDASGSTTTQAPTTLSLDQFQEPTHTQLLANNSSHKLKPINFTLVDEIFNSSLDDDELVKRWKNMDSQFQEGIRSILKLVFPQIVAISQDAKVSGDCSGGILKWILSLRNLRSWAIKMLDATGKPTAGIFQGSLTMFGNYRQCLSIRAPDEDEIEITDQFEEYFRGQFCVLHLKPWMPIKKPFYHLNSTIEPLLRKNYKYYEKTLYDELAEIAIAFNFIDIRMDLCVPSTCTVADIQRVADLLSRKLEMRAKVMRCDISSRDIGTGMLHYLDQTTLIWLVVPTSIIGLVIFGTLLVFLGFGPSSGEDESSSSNEQRDGSNGQTQRSGLRNIGRLLECLSVQGILRNRLKVPKMVDSATMDDNNNNHTDLGEQRATLLMAQCKPLPLYGLRNLFIFWFIIVQMTVELKYQYLRESLVLRNMLLNYWPFQIIINSVLLFDSIILITAFIYSYSNLESTFKELIRYIFDKYLRLVPAILTLVALTIITPLINIESPVWQNFVEQQAEICKQTGYLDLFFLQNFISYEKILIILSIPLILLLKKTFVDNEDSIVIKHSEKNSLGRYGSQFENNLKQMLKTRIGWTGLLLVLFGMTINFVLVYVNQLPPSWFYSFPDVDQKNYYFGKYLSRTWVHLTAFFIGLYAGHLVRSTQQLNHLEQLRSILSIPKMKNTICTLASNGYSVGSTVEHDEIRRQQQQQQQQQSSTGFMSLKFSIQFAALVSMATVIFSTYSWSTQEAPSTLVAALYDSSSRLVWSLGLVAIIIGLCLPEDDDNSGADNKSNGGGGGVGCGRKTNRLARFLSHPGCIILGRLSFLAYLISPYVHTFVLAVEEQSLFPSLFLIFHVIVGNIVITYLLAFILSIVIEQPIRLLLARLNCRTRSTARFFMPGELENGRGEAAASAAAQRNGGGGARTLGPNNNIKAATAAAPVLNVCATSTNEGPKIIKPNQN